MAIFSIIFLYLTLHCSTSDSALALFKTIFIGGAKYILLKSKLCKLLWVKADLHGQSNVKKKKTN